MHAAVPSVAKNGFPLTTPECPDKELEKQKRAEESAIGSLRLLGNRKMQYFIPFIVFRSLSFAN